METKTKWSALWAYLAGLGALGVLNWVTTTNLVAGLPDVVEAFAAPLLPALTVLVVGYNVRHKPASLSDSAIDAARARVASLRHG